MKEIEEDLNEWRDTLCPWVGVINIIKLSILFKLIYRFYTIPVKILVALVAFERHCKKMKRQTTDWEKMHAKHMEEFISRIYLELLQLNKARHPVFLKGVKDLNRQFDNFLINQQ